MNKEDLTKLFADFLVDFEKGEDGNKAAQVRARKTSLKIQEAMKTYRAYSLGHI